MQCRSAVEHDGVILDDVFEDLPDLFAAFLDLSLRVLDVERDLTLHEPAYHERLEKFQGHLLRKSALINLQLRPNDDNRTPGVVDALAEQVLTEAAFLSSQQVREALQRSVARAEDCLADPAVVDESVNTLLQHSLLVSDDDLRGVECLQLFEPVVTVDDTAI